MTSCRLVTILRQRLARNDWTRRWTSSTWRGRASLSATRGLTITYVRWRCCREVEMLPRPLRQLRVPVWVAGGWPNRAPFRRTARWGGALLKPVNVETGEVLTPDELNQAIAYMRSRRLGDEPFEVLMSEETPGDALAAAEIVRPYQLARREDPWLEPWGGNAARRQALPTTGHQTTRCAIRTLYRRACGKVRVGGGFGPRHDRVRRS